MSVLIVEGARGIRRPLRDQLHDQGVEVTTAGTVGEALAVLRTASFNVVVLDVAMPDGSGLEVLDGLRRSGSVAHVIVMSGSTAEQDRVAASERGADDYVVKPIMMGELVTRVLAARRRGDPHRDACVQIGPLTIDLLARQVRADGRLLELTGKEFDLLAYLAARPGYVFSRDQLLRAVWRSEPGWQQDATVTEHVRRLRSKIETDPGRPRILRTVRGSGYRLDLPTDGIDAGGQRSRFAPGTLVHVGGRIVRADQATGALLGLARGADLVGRQVLELVASASKDAMRERLTNSESNPHQRSQLVDLERSDGTEMSAEVASEAIDWKGQPAHKVTLTHIPDASARLRHLVTGVLSELTDAVIITDLHFHLRSWNSAAERLYGWNEQDVLGRHLLDVIRWVDNDDALTAIWESLEVNGRWKGEARQVTRDGSVISVLENTTLVLDDAGEPVLIVSVNRFAGASSAAHESASGSDHQIRHGLANDEFEVYYQPVVALDDLRVVGIEALARWNHPERGLLGPPSFIDAAEHSGSIVQLGNVILTKACRQAVEWRQAGIDIELSVNLSARQLADPDLYDRITTVLAETGLAPNKVWLELTETALVEEVDRASKVLHRLADFGIGIAIDDFGTGWASLTYLKSFPIHALKIDRSFVAGVDHNAHDTAIARSILSLGAELGLHVIAEGIETTSQQHALRGLGCTTGQGFLFGRPTPASTTPTRQVHTIGPSSTPQ